jgi:hypothetical protein
MRRAWIADAGRDLLVALMQRAGKVSAFLFICCKGGWHIQCTGGNH